MEGGRNLGSGASVAGGGAEARPDPQCHGSAEARESRRRFPAESEVALGSSGGRWTRFLCPGRIFLGLRAARPLCYARSLDRTSDNDELEPLIFRGTDPMG